MTTKTEKEIAGQLIPNAYISKITLETAKWEESETSVFDNLTPDNKISSPNVITLLKSPTLLAEENGDFSKVEEQPLKVSLDIVAKVFLPRGSIGTWLGQNDFIKYLRIAVVQSTSTKLTERVSRNVEQITSPEFENTNILLRRKNFTLPQDILGDIEKIDFRDYEIDSQGNKVLNAPLRQTFYLPRSPKHLSYFIVSYLDLNAMRNDFNMDVNNNSIAFSSSKVLTENVITNGKINNKSYFFTDKDGVPWTGAVFLTEDGGYESGGNNPISLLRVEKRNSKVQDFRKMKQLERQQFDFSLLRNSRVVLRSKNVRTNANLPIDGSSYFTPISLSQDEEANVRFFFGFDVRRALQDSSAYGKFYQNGKTFERALANTSIRRITLFRQRIGGSPEGGSAPDRTRLFDKNKNPEPLITSKDASVNRESFVSVSNEKASLTELQNIYVENPRAVGFRYFTGVDKTAKNLTDGYFQFFVEVEIIDGGFEVLRELYNELEASIKKLENYYSKATKIGQKGFRQESDNPHLDFPDELRIQKGVSKPGAYDTTTNRFTDDFTSKMFDKWGYGNEKSPWNESVSTYIKMLSLLTNITTNTLQENREFLSIVVSPKTGNPEGILQLLNLMKTLTNRFRNFLGLGINAGFSIGQKQNKQTKETRTKMNSGKVARTITLKKTFYDIINTNLLTNTGYDFLSVSPTTDNLTGLKVISPAQFAERVKKETETIFEIGDGQLPNIDIEVGTEKFTEGDSVDESSYSYLGPARALLNGEVLFERIGNSPSPKIEASKLSFFNTAVKTKNFSSRYVRPSAKSSPIALNSRKKADKLKSSLSTTPQDLSIRLSLQDTFSSIGITPVVSATMGKNLPISNLKKNQTRDERNAQKIDIITEKQNRCGLEGADLETTNPTPVLLNILEKVEIDLDTRQVDGIPATFTPKFVGQSQTSFERYDLSKRGNFMENVLQKPENIESEVFFRGRQHNTTLSDALKTLPNQTKALFLQHTKPNIVKKNWVAENKTDVNENVETKTEFEVFQNIISAIDVFAGYAIDYTTGEPLAMSPVWRPLTLQKYENIRGKNLLCRFKSYENDLVGVRMDKGLSMPVFDEFFILRAREAVEPPQRTPPLVLEKPRISTRKLGSLREVSLSLLNAFEGLKVFFGDTEENFVPRVSIDVETPVVELADGVIETEPVSATPVFTPADVELSFCPTAQEEALDDNIPTDYTTTNSNSFSLNTNISVEDVSNGISEEVELNREGQTFFFGNNNG